MDAKIAASQRRRCQKRVSRCELIDAPYSLIILMAYYAPYISRGQGNLREASCLCYEMME